MLTEIYTVQARMGGVQGRLLNYTGHLLFSRVIAVQFTDNVL